MLLLIRIIYANISEGSGAQQTSRVIFILRTTIQQFLAQAKHKICNTMSQMSQNTPASIKLCRLFVGTCNNKDYSGGRAFFASTKIHDYKRAF